MHLFPFSAELHNACIPAHRRDRYRLKIAPRRDNDEDYLAAVGCFAGCLEVARLVGIFSDSPPCDMGVHTGQGNANTRQAEAMHLGRHHASSLLSRKRHRGPVDSRAQSFSPCHQPTPEALPPPVAIACAARRRHRVALLGANRLAQGHPSGSRRFSDVALTGAASKLPAFRPRN